MKKIIAVALLGAILFTSCADSKTFYIDGKKTEVKPYGWMNADARKVPGVTYKVCVGNVVWSVVLGETLAAPLLFTGLSLFEPVYYEEPTQQ